MSCTQVKRNECCGFNCFINVMLYAQRSNTDHSPQDNGTQHTAPRLYCLTSDSQVQPSQVGTGVCIFFNPTQTARTSHASFSTHHEFNAPFQPFLPFPHRPTCNSFCLFERQPDLHSIHLSIPRQHHHHQVVLGSYTTHHF